MNSVSSLTLFTEEASPATRAAQAVRYDEESRSTYISLPRLFNLPLEDIRHGIILKNDNDTDNKIILLTTKVECETDIPAGEIYSVPKVFNCLRFSSLFSGIQFASRLRQRHTVSDSANSSSDNSEDIPVLLLNPEYLIQTHGTPGSVKPEVSREPAL